MDETYSAVIHRINHAIRWRASHPSDPIPEPAQILTQFSKPPASLVAKASTILERLTVLADVKKGDSTGPGFQSYADQEQYPPKQRVEGTGVMN